MRVVFAVAVFALAACSSQAEEEEQKYRIVERQTEGQMFKYKTRCPQARAVEQAYLAEKNEAQYKSWHLQAELDCALMDQAYD